MGRIRVIVLALAGIMLAVGLAMVAFYEKQKYIPDPTKARKAKAKKAKERQIEQQEIEQEIDQEIENYGSQEEDIEHSDKG